MGIFDKAREKIGDIGRSLREGIGGIVNRIGEAQNLPIGSNVPHAVTQPSGPTLNVGGSSGGQTNVFQKGGGTTQSPNKPAQPGAFNNYGGSSGGGGSNILNSSISNTVQQSTDPNIISKDIPAQVPTISQEQIRQVQQQNITKQQMDIPRFAVTAVTQPKTQNFLERVKGYADKIPNPFKKESRLIEPTANLITSGVVLAKNIIDQRTKDNQKIIQSNIQKGKEEIDTYTQVVQSGLDAGSMSLTDAQTLVDNKVKEITTQTQQNINNDLGKRGTSLKEQLALGTISLVQIGSERKLPQVKEPFSFRKLGEKIAKEYTPLSPAYQTATAETRLIITTPSEKGTYSRVSEQLTKQGSIQAGIGLLFMGLQGGTIASQGARSLTEATAEGIINRGLRSGEFKITKEMLESGKVKINIPSIGNKVEEVTLNYGKENLGKLDKSIKAIEKAKSFYNLPKKAEFELVGSIEERNIIEQAIIQQRPDLVNQIKNIEIGRFITDTPSGKKSTAYIVRSTIQNQEGQNSLILSFRLREGKVVGLKGNFEILDRTTNKVDGIAFSELSKSRLPKNIKVQVPENVNPLEVFPTQRFKAKTYTRVGQTNILSVEKNNRVYKQIEKKGLAILTGKVKGTISFDDLVNRKMMVVKMQKPNKYITSQSKRLEIISFPQDINLESQNELITLSKKIGTQSKGISLEKGKLMEENILGFDITKVRQPSLPKKVIPSKTISSIEEIPDILNIPKETSKPIEIQEVKLPEYPSYVGGGKGEGGGSSAYGIDTLNLPTIQNLISEEQIGALGFNLKSPQIKNIQIPELKNNLFQQGKTQEVISLNSLTNIFKTRPQLTTEQKSNINLDKLFKQPELIDTRKILLNENKPFIDIAQRPIQYPQLEQPQIQVPQLTIPQLKIPQIQMPKFKMPKPIIDLPVIFPPISFPSSSSGGGKKKPKTIKRRIKKFSGQYTSSLGAALFQEKPIKVSRKEYERLSKSVFSGIETRPVLEIIEDQKAIKKALKKVNF